MSDDTKDDSEMSGTDLVIREWNRCYKLRTASREIMAAYNESRARPNTLESDAHLLSRIQATADKYGLKIDDDKGGK